MCGRFVMTSPAQAIAEIFSAGGRPNLPASYNVAPTQSVATVRMGEAGDRLLDTASWGLLPRWAKTRREQAKTINARGETAAEKPTFRGPFRHDRIVIPASGFFEWRRDGDAKQPFYIHPTDRDLFAFAGLRAVWRDPAAGVDLATCCIVTTGPNATMAAIHHRMPVILTGPDAWTVWLEGEVEAANDLIGPAPDEGMAVHPVDRRVGRVSENDPGLIVPIDPVPPTHGNGGAPSEEPAEAPPVQGKLL